jgi:hypothetical protein
MERQNESIARTSKGILVVLILIFAILIGIFFYFIACKQCGTPADTSEKFGSQDVNGTYSADALAMTYDGKRVGEGIEKAADPPTILFEDNFEGSSPWTSVEDVDEASPVAYWGTKAAYFDPAVDGRASLSKTFSPAITIDADEMVEIYFYVNAATAWDTGDNDYFIVKFTFDGGNSLVYVVMGDYSPASSSEAVISVTTQVTAKNIWAGINIQHVDDDYIAQFGGTLPVPAVTGLSFILDTSEPAEYIRMDEMQLVKLPKEFAGGAYWKKIPAGEKVTSYFVDVLYKILISSEIDPTNVHVEIKLWIEIYDTPSKTTKLLAKTLVQDEIIAHITTGSDLTWTSKTFSLPEDDAVFGANLYYSFSIQIEAWGEVIADPGTFIYAVGNANDFDALQFQWIVATGSIDVIIYALGTAGIAGGGLALVGLRKKRKSSDAVRRAIERESLFN